MRTKKKKKKKKPTEQASKQVNVRRMSERAFDCNKLTSQYSFAKRNVFIDIRDGKERREEERSKVWPNQTVLTQYLKLLLLILLKHSDPCPTTQRSKLA